jgi:hypothetical protein
MQATLPLDDLDLGALRAVLAGQPSAASAALELALAEALTAEAEACGCPATEDLCGPCAQLTERAITHRKRAGRLGGTS